MPGDTGPCGYSHAAIPGLKRGGEDCGACAEMSLKPCPFCGGRASARPRYNTPRGYVECVDCHCITADASDWRVLAIMWNRRAAPEAGHRIYERENEARELEQGCLCKCGAYVPLGWEHVCEFQTTRPPSR